MKKQHLARTRKMLRRRISAALHAEMLKNRRTPPNEKRMQAVSEQEIEKARTEGLIPPDEDFDPASKFLNGLDSGLSGGSLFGGKRSRLRGIRSSGQTSRHAPRSDRMHMPRRNHSPSRARQRHRRTRGGPQESAAGGKSRPSPDLNDLPLPGIKAGQTPKQLNQTLRRLLK